MSVTTNGIVCQGKYSISSPNKCHPLYVELIEGLPSRINLLENRTMLVNFDRRETRIMFGINLSR